MGCATFFKLFKFLFFSELLTQRWLCPFPSVTAIVAHWWVAQFKINSGRFQPAPSLAPDAFQFIHNGKFCMLIACMRTLDLDSVLSRTKRFTHITQCSLWLLWQNKLWAAIKRAYFCFNFSSGAVCRVFLVWMYLLAAAARCTCHYFWWHHNCVLSSRWTGPLHVPHHVCFSYYFSFSTIKGELSVFRKKKGQPTNFRLTWLSLQARGIKPTSAENQGC